MSLINQNMIQIISQAHKFRISSTRNWTHIPYANQL